MSYPLLQCPPPLSQIQIHSIPGSITKNVADHAILGVHLSTTPPTTHTFSVNWRQSTNSHKLFWILSQIFLKYGSGFGIAPWTFLHSQILDFLETYPSWQCHPTIITKINALFSAALRKCPSSHRVFLLSRESLYSVCLTCGIYHLVFLDTLLMLVFALQLDSSLRAVAKSYFLLYPNQESAARTEPLKTELSLCFPLHREPWPHHCFFSHASPGGTQNYGESMGVSHALTQEATPMCNIGFC